VSVPYVITDRCTRDGACVEVCPVACIHTTPDAPQFYVDPDICIECEQCVVVCPVEAIFLDADLPTEYRPFIDVNARFFRQHKAAVEPIHLDEAWAMVRAAQAYAAEVGLAVAVAVVDESGTLIALGRMDGAPPMAAELAYHKAYTAAGFQVPTDELVPDRRQPWFRSLAIASRGRIMAAGGGVPVAEGISLLGAIGVAGNGREEQDILCCRAGLGVLSGPGH
jgi:ferredoxin--NADP+ reductase